MHHISHQDVTHQFQIRVIPEIGMRTVSSCHILFNKGLSVTEVTETRFLNIYIQAFL